MIRGASLTAATDLTFAFCFYAVYVQRRRAR
jgi:hypothetical protein